jgi:triacylglycerol lipase
MVLNLTRRAWLRAAAAALLLLGGCATPPHSDLPPIVFVHGNGDNAAVWTTVMWRFESNGWPRERLHAIDLPYPLARDEDDKQQPGRSSSDEHMRALAAEVDKVLQASGARRVVLYGSSRGANAIRNYVDNGGGAAKVSHAILGGGVNHGAWVNPKFLPRSEFNGAGPLMTALNAPHGAGGDEVSPALKWLSIRSDNNDKWAQPDGVWLGAKGTPTNITFSSPDLKGATNVVLPARDHREVAFHREAFAAAYQFITGRAPALDIAPEERVLLDGLVSGPGPSGPTNVPLAGATVEVYAVDAGTGTRHGIAAHRKTVGADGRWGPFSADGKSAYEFVVSAPGVANTHIYRSPFPRSSNVVHLRAERLAEADKTAASIVTFTRPRGYFGLPRDSILLDGRRPPGVPDGVAGVSTSTLKLADGVGRSVLAEFNGTRLAGVAWPAAEDHVVLLELHE